MPVFQPKNVILSMYFYLLLFSSEPDHSRFFKSRPRDIWCGILIAVMFDRARGTDPNFLASHFLLSFCQAELRFDVFCWRYFNKRSTASRSAAFFTALIKLQARRESAFYQAAKQPYYSLFCQTVQTILPHLQLLSCQHNCSTALIANAKSLCHQRGENEGLLYR